MLNSSLMKKKISIFFTTVIILTSVIFMSGCSKEYYFDKSDKWKKEFDISSPSVENIQLSNKGETFANSDGWYLTLYDDFENGLSNQWSHSKNYLRKVEYWCDSMVSAKDGNIVVAAEKSDNHICDNCPTKSGLFTSGIETRKYKKDGTPEMLFEQAFGFFEARVKFPYSDGMWSAFWLQSDSMNNIGNEGKDGSEIDIYESSFWKNKSKVGHCIHYDGYAKKHRGGGAERDTGKDLYDGFHTFALKWTPNEYVFYVDGVATWASNFGGISRVPAFIKLTNEIRPNMTGPYSQKLGEMTGGEFVIDYVKVYQNKNYHNEIKSPNDFK